MNVYSYDYERCKREELFHMHSYAAVPAHRLVIMQLQAGQQVGLEYKHVIKK
jgi:hypothetical protein